MAIKVDPFLIKIPNKLLNDKELNGYFVYLNRTIHDLIKRTGGGDDAVAELQNDDTYETGVQSAAFADLYEGSDEQPLFSAIEVDETEESIVSSAEFEWSITEITSDYTMNPFEVAKCSNLIKLNMPSNPADLDRVKFWNTDGKRKRINGNGNNIHSFSYIYSQRKGTVLDFQYFASDGQWVIV